MCTGLLEWFYQSTVGRVVLPEDNFTTIVRKIIATIFFIATLFGGGSPYYAYRAFVAKSDPREAGYYYSLVVLSGSLAAFAFLVCLPVGLYVFCTKTAPDWVLQYCIVATFFVTVGWDISCTYFPVRSTSLGLAFVSIGSSLPLSNPIVCLIALYYLLVEVRDAWDITALRVTNPSYAGGPIEKFVTSMTGFFCLVMCSALMGGMLFEYTTLLSNAAKSVELAKNVASMLLLYDTDLVRDELDQFEEVNGLKELQDEKKKNEQRQDTGVLQIEDENNDNNTSKKQTKKQNSNLELLQIFREMAKNLDMYRPHLPDYVLPKYNNDEDSSTVLGSKVGESGYLKSSNSNNNAASPYGRGNNNNQRHSHHRSNNSRSGWRSEEEEMSEGGLTNSTEGDEDSLAHSINNAPSFPPGAGGRRKSIGGPLPPSSNPSTTVATLNQLQIGKDNRPSPLGDAASSVANGSRARNHLVAQQGKAMKQNMQGGMMNRQGAQYDSVVVARIDFERFITYLLDVSGAAASNGSGVLSSPVIDSDLLSPRINAMVTRILDVAASVDGTVHSLFEDSLMISWNATRRTNQNEYKCCKFLVEMKNLVFQTASTTVMTPVNAGALASGKIGGNQQQQQQQQQLPPVGNTSVASSNSGIFPAAPSPLKASPSGAAENNNNNSFSPGSFQSTFSLISVAAVTGTAWCQISGSDKRQIFTLSKFSSTEALRKLAEFARRHGFMVVDHQIQSRGRIEYNVQGCGAVVVPRPEHNVFWERTQGKEFQHANQPMGTYLANALKHRRSTLIGNGIITNQNANINNNSGASKVSPAAQDLVVTFVKESQHHHQQQPQVVFVSMDGNNNNNVGGSPPPVERRNTQMFKKDFGWDAESDNNKDTGQMVLGGSAALGKIPSSNNNNNNNQDGMGLKSPTGIYDGINGSESFSSHIAVTSPEEQILKRSPQTKGPGPINQPATGNNNNNNNNIYNEPALNGSASTDGKSNNFHRPGTPQKPSGNNSHGSHGSQIVPQQQYYHEGIPTTLSTGATPPAFPLSHPLNNNSINNPNFGVGPNSNSTSNTPNVYSLQQQMFRAPQLNYADTYIVPCYELLGLKAAAEDDEWLYQVQDKDMLSGSLTDAVNFLAQGHVAKAELVMNRLRQDVLHCEDNCAAFRSIMLCMEDIKIRNDTNLNLNSAVAAGKQ